MSRRFVCLLEEEKLISKEQKEYFIEKEKIDKLSADELVLSGNVVESHIMERILEQRFNIKTIYMYGLKVDKTSAKKITKEFAYNNLVIPFKVENNMLHIVMSNPFDKKIVDEIRFLVHMDIVIYYGDRNRIISAIQNIYDGEVLEKAVEQFKEEYFIEVDDNNVEQSIENAPAVKITNSIIKKGINLGVSDIHLEPNENDVRVRMRIDGQLYEKFNMPKKVYSAVCTRIKIEANMDISKKFVSQDGKMQWNVEGNSYNFRISSIPTIDGEKLVIRILYNNEGLIHLDVLGFNDGGNEKIRNLIKKTRGLFLVTGPTGSGKSTTLYALIEEMDKIHNNIITIEDPVEYRISGINQVNVNNKAGVTFASGLRSVLRQDPDIIMIGEIRDEETAEIAVRSAITGHLVLSTIHTYDSISSILRLIDMNVPNYLAADAVTAVIAQRLVRKICTNCKYSYEPEGWERKILNLKPGEKIFKGRGCEKCSYTGYSGRSVVYEILELTDKHRRIIHSHMNVDILREYCLKNGMISLKDNCIELVKKGVTTYDQLMRIVLSNN
jgi:type IV pilus assembly protein PilB